MPLRAGPSCAKASGKMRLRVAWALVATLAAACAANLPSTTPLGEGPMVGAEALALSNSIADAGKAFALRPDAGRPAPAGTSSSTAEAPPALDGGAASVASADSGTKPVKSDAGGAAPTATITYAGEYLGSDDSNYDLDGNASSEHDDKARTRVEVRSSGELAFTFVSSSDGTDICTLTATAKGKDATFGAGQACWATPGGGGKLTKGSAHFEGKKLVIDADFDLTAGPMTGSLSYHFDGTRQ